VLKAWSGLGYNRRAMLMKRAAELVVSEHGGRLPVDVDELVKLPGIGPATAGAIAAFAFGQAVPFVETNIRTVFLHQFFKGRDGVHDAEIMPLVARTIDREDPRRWYFALMDYGVVLKRQERGINSRSAHYVRQGRFAGSDREARGLILRALTVKGSSERELVESTKLAAGRLRRNIASLEREGMIVRRRGKLTVA
jgi:A/G-specific adenine glycosylase